MHNLSDDELDRLSREAAEHHRIPVDASLWEKVVRSLERDMPAGQGFNYHVIPDLALLLLLFIGLPVLYSVPAKQPAIYIKQEIKTNSGKTGNNLVASESATAKQPSENLSAGKQSAKVQAKQSEIVKDPAENPAILSPAQPASSGPAKETRITDKNSRKLAGPQQNKPGTTRDFDASGGNFSPVYADGQSDHSAAAAGLKSDNKIRTWDLATLEERQLINKSYAIAAPSKLIAPDVFPEPSDAVKSDAPATTKAGKKKRENDPSSNSSSMVEFGLTWGPDFSKVGSAPAGNVGNIYGFVAAFNFNKRWSLNTGILYSNKNYTAMGDEYEKIPGYDPADPDIKIKKVQAECLMWDLPINVRYNWYWRQKQRAFVSTGLSSYFMKEEDLKYWYTYYNNPKYKEWVNTNSSNYWFAVLNLSAGFEQQLFEGVTVQAEPFLKLSLSEVGYGKVNLKSWGVFLGLKYIPPIHRIKK